MRYCGRLSRGCSPTPSGGGGVRRDTKAIIKRRCPKLLRRYQQQQPEGKLRQGSGCRHPTSAAGGAAQTKLNDWRCSNCLLMPQQWLARGAGSCPQRAPRTPPRMRTKMPRLTAARHVFINHADGTPGTRAWHAAPAARHRAPGARPRAGRCNLRDPKNTCARQAPE